MPFIQGWEVSPGREKMFEKILETDPVGDPIITSKCKLDKENGFLVASDNGFSWRIKMGYSTALMSAGKSKWVRWYDVYNIIPKGNGQIMVQFKKRKNGLLIIDKKGNYKLGQWKLTLNRNSDEPKDNFKQRQQNFAMIMTEIFNRNKGTDVETSDSRM